MIRQNTTAFDAKNDPIRGIPSKPCLKKSDATLNLTLHKRFNDSTNSIFLIA